MRHPAGEHDVRQAQPAGAPQHPSRLCQTLLLIGPLVGFFGAGHFAGFGVVTGELFPTSIRATAQGFTYNIGRGISALAPFTIGTLADRFGFTVAFYLTAVMYCLTGMSLLLIPETRKSLEVS